MNIIEKISKLCKPKQSSILNGVPDHIEKLRARVGIKDGTTLSVGEKKELLNRATENLGGKINNLPKFVNTNLSKKRMIS